MKNTEWRAARRVGSSLRYCCLKCSLPRPTHSSGQTHCQTFLILCISFICEPRWSFCYFLLPFLMIMYFHKNYITPYLPDANACLRLHNIHTKLYSGILYSDITVIHCKHYCDDSSLVVTVSCKQTVICFFKDTKNLLYFPKSAARNSQ